MDDVTRGGARSLRTAIIAYPGLISSCPFRALKQRRATFGISESGKRETIGQWFRRTNREPGWLVESLPIGSADAERGKRSLPLDD